MPQLTAIAVRRYIQVLEVDWPASLAELKAAHRRLMRTWHPDRMGGTPLQAEAEEKTKQINLAMDELCRALDEGYTFVCADCSHIEDLQQGLCRRCGDLRTLKRQAAAQQARPPSPPQGRSGATAPPPRSAPPPPQTPQLEPLLPGVYRLTTPQHGAVQQGLQMFGVSASDVMVELQRSHALVGRQDFGGVGLGFDVSMGISGAWGLIDTQHLQMRLDFQLQMPTYHNPFVQMFAQPQLPLGGESHLLTFHVQLAPSGQLSFRDVRGQWLMTRA